MKHVFKTDAELKVFIVDNIITTMEAAEILDCSRQNIDRLVSIGKLTPLKQTQRDKLFWKNDILDRLKPSE